MKNLIPFLRATLKWANARANCERNRRTHANNRRRYLYWERVRNRAGEKSNQLARRVTVAEWDELHRQVDARR